MMRCITSETEWALILADVSDHRRRARQRLPRFLFDYIDGGAFAETTLRRNVDDLQALTVRQRVLRDVSEVDTCASFFGEPAAMPLALGPVGLAGLYSRRGEVQAARAAEALGVPFCLSTVSACTVEEVRAGVRQPFWFQLYMLRDRGFMREMLARARAAGSTTLLFTVDMPAPGSRYRDKRSGLSGGTPLQRRFARLAQVAARPAWAWDVGVRGRPHTLGHVASVLGGSAGVEEFWAWMRDNFDPTVTWRDLAAVRDEWPGALVIKGVLDAEDARQAFASGADGIVVSNHGGRQLDGAQSSISALPAIREAVGERATVFMDGGVRTGLDVFKALASGADGALIGRAWSYGLAAGGESGVADVLRLLHDELRIAMALAGCRTLAQIGPGTLLGASSVDRAQEPQRRNRA